MVESGVAEFVRGRGGKAVELREMLLARQRQFGRRQRVGELARALGDLPRIGADEADREHDREPEPEHKERRQRERVFAHPRQRIVVKNASTVAQTIANTPSTTV